ncbi:PQQ-binding-like beta-propeller repeat protein [Schlesneria sp. T3-172]|uniref:outer membrane protein assembly factor BamB family protein n=1 Tax=Schlesneria sphaerica TaxID=3373610 RepID=UPI0037CB0F1A
MDNSLATRVAVAIVLTIQAGLIADDWPHWRGPYRNGHLNEKSGWNGQTWLADKPDWTLEVGEGASSPLVVGPSVFALGWAEGNDTLRCLDAATGKTVWSVARPAPQWGRFHDGDEGMYSGACSTPEYDSETKFIYTLGVDGDLICRDTRNSGKTVWEINLYETYHVKKRPRLTRAPQRDYGYTSSPLVHGDWLLVEVGADSGCLKAFDKRTGQLIWSSECVDPAGHNGGPVLITVESVPCVGLFTVNGLVVIRLDEGHEGKTVGTYPWITDFANNVASLAVHEDNLLITSQYNHKSICRLKVTLSGIEKVWEADYSSKVCTPIIHKGFVYFTWQRLRCLDWETGEQKWEGGSFSDPGSCIVTSDDRLIVYGFNGRLALVETAVRSPEEYVELSVQERLFRTEAWPHVVMSGGRIFCRDRLGNLACFRVVD